MSVAVFGLGGVGLSAVMGARLAGAHPIIAVDIRPEKLELARKAGATHGVNAQETDPVTAIRDLTGGGVHYAFESVGNERVLAQAYQATRRGGTTVTIGLPHPERLFSVPAVSIVGEERIIKGLLSPPGCPSGWPGASPGLPVWVGAGVSGGRCGHGAVQKAGSGVGREQAVARPATRASPIQRLFPFIFHRAPP